jgi:N-carbamoylputrescine amidase
MTCGNAQITANLAQASLCIAQAAAAGAELVLLPELLATGYIYSKQIWDAAEPSHGPTATWLAREAKAHGVYVGTSFLEADGHDFFNTFVLTTPLGHEAGRVRKQTPALFETFFTRGDVGSHVIDTEFGRVGVGICYENHLAFTRKHFYERAVDLVLMPHSTPTPDLRGPLFTRTLELYDEALRAVAVECAQALGVPVVFANKSGAWSSPLPGVPGAWQDSSFPGLSAIVDADGSVKARLGAQPGVLVEDVYLDPRRQVRVPPPTFGRWARPTPSAAHLMMVPEFIGRFWYQWSRARKARAREVSRAGQTTR